MIIKVIGVCDGEYRERTWEDVDDYIFTNRDDNLHDLVFTGDKNTPYSSVKLIFAQKDKDSISISFSDKVFVMDARGKTIDVLKHSRDKERYGKGV